MLIPNTLAQMGRAKGPDCETMHEEVMTVFCFLSAVSEAKQHQVVGLEYVAEGCALCHKKTAPIRWCPVCCIWTHRRCQKLAIDQYHAACRAAPASSGGYSMFRGLRSGLKERLEVVVQSFATSCKAPYGIGFGDNDVFCIACEDIAKQSE